MTSPMCLDGLDVLDAMAVLRAAFPAPSSYWRWSEAKNFDGALVTSRLSLNPVNLGEVR
jgi:hypothetical protein